MPTNIEIKARVHDMARLRALVIPLATAPAEVLHQEDVFFHARRGRLKLRIFDEGHGELIGYTRPDAKGPKTSAYQISVTEEPARLRGILAAALGEQGVVTKRRELHRIGRTRVHLDEVEGLGSFMELEVVLDTGEAPARGEGIAQELIARLEIAETDLIAGAYFDLIRSRDAGA